MIDLADLEAIEDRWLRQCAACDAGLAMSCACPEGDPRNVIANLVDEVKRIRQQVEAYGQQIDEMYAQYRPVETLLVQVIEAQGLLAQTGHCATPSKVPQLPLVYARLTRIADGLRSVLARVHGQESP